MLTTPLKFKEEVEYEVIRGMTEVDLELLATTPNRYEVRPLQRLTERHHAIARLIAAGTSHTNAAHIVGVHRNRITILMADASFQELVQFYREEVNSSYLDAQAQMAGLGADAIAELRRRVEENPEQLGANFLLDLVKVTADRTGNGPTTKSTQEVNVTIDLAARMKAAREAAAAALEPPIVDVTPREAAE